MSALRNLAGQTAIYGLSSIGARFLNYLLVPLYTSKGVFEPAEYGVVTSLYAWTAFLNVVLTFGMETTFFRFSAKANSTLEKGSVFTTGSISNNGVRSASLSVSDSSALCLTNNSGAIVAIRGIV